MKYSAEKNEDYAFLAIQENRLDTVVAPSLKSELVLLVNAGYKFICIDMSEVSFVDSSGLSALLVGNRNCATNNGVLVLTQIQSSVQRLIDITKLNDILKVIPNKDEARDFIMLSRLEDEINSAGEEKKDEDID